jgi:K(+)-stimulated pyrophosphate-energized sodium pump
MAETLPWEGRASAGKCAAGIFRPGDQGEENSMTVILGVIVCGLLSIIYAVWATRSVMAADQGN